MDERNESHALWVGAMALLLVFAISIALSQVNVVSRTIDKAAAGAETFNHQQIRQLKDVPEYRIKGFEIVQNLHQLSSGTLEYDIRVEGRLYQKDFPLSDLDPASINTKQEYIPTIIRDDTGQIKEVEYR